MKVNVVRYLGRHFVFWFGVAIALLSAQAETVQTNLAVTTQQSPSLNGGTIQGSLQELTGASFNVNSGFSLTGDLLVPGTPTLTLNGSPTFSGTVVGSGSTSPTGYPITLNSGCSLRYLRTRTTPITLPNVPAPPAPTGTRSVNINSAGQSYGAASTLNNLTLNGNVGVYSLPPGTYGTFAVNGGAGLILGVTGAVQAVSYNLQNLNLNSDSSVQVVGPVVLTVANGFSANGVLGASNNPTWLQVQVASGGLTLNSGCTLYGSVLAPHGTVCIDGNSTLAGVSASQQFTLNSGGLVRWSGASTQTNSPPPTATPQSITLAENTSTNITLTGSDPQGKALTYALLTVPTHGTVSGTPPSVTYKPATNYFGSDSFTFDVNNGTTNSAPATISLTVSPVYYLPTAFGQSLTNLENAALPVTLTGSDPEGYALAYSVVAQPTHGTLSGTAPSLSYLPATNYYGSDAFTFRVNDGVSNSPVATISITNRAVDYPPVVAAGASQSIIWPSNLVNLAGTVSYANFPGTVDRVRWSEVSGPGSVTFGDASSAVTTATFSTNGVYRLQWFASDSFLSASNSMWVTVDQAPTVTIASPAMINWPNTQVTLSGTVTDDGLPTGGALVTTWSQVSGPGSVSFSTVTTSNALTGSAITNAVNGTATFTASGVYTLQLTASDGYATNHATTTVIVNAPPVVSAGADQAIALGSPVALAGSFTDDGISGLSVTVQWTQTSGPVGVAIANPSATNTAVSFTQSGVYGFQLMVGDGMTNGSSQTTITVYQAPKVTVASPALVPSPNNEVSLSGTVTDDGLPVGGTLTAIWTEVSGPGSVTFSPAAQSDSLYGVSTTLSPSITASFSAAGQYGLRLTANDGLAAAHADVTVTVNQPPEPP